MANTNDALTAPMGVSKRRALLTGAAYAGAAAALSTGAVAPAHASGADKELIDLCTAWRQAADRLIPVAERLAEVLDGDWSEDDRVLDRELSNEVCGLEQRIFGIEAATLVGLRAKAGVLDYMDTAMGIPATPGYAASLVADIMALGSAW